MNVVLIIIIDILQSLAIIGLGCALARNARMTTRMAELMTEVSAVVAQQVYGRDPEHEKEDE